MVHRNAALSETGRRRLARCIVDDGWLLRRAAERSRSRTRPQTRHMPDPPKTGPERAGAAAPGPSPGSAPTPPDAAERGQLPGHGHDHRRCPDLPRDHQPDRSAGRAVCRAAEPRRQPGQRGAAGRHRSDGHPGRKRDLHNLGKRAGRAALLRHSAIPRRHPPANGRRAVSSTAASRAGRHAARHTGRHSAVRSSTARRARKGARRPGGCSP